MNDTLLVLGRIAGIGGVAIGVLLVLFRDIIRKNIFPTLTKQQGYSVLRLIIVLVWTVALVGIAAWTVVAISEGRGQPESDPQDHSLKLYDSETNARVYRDFTVEISTNGVVDTFGGQRGELELSEEYLDSLDSIKVNCEGYAFQSVARRSPNESAISLLRNDGEYSRIITPPDYARFGRHPNSEEFKNAVSNEEPSDSVRLTCVNNTDTAIDLILIEYMPADDPRPRTAENLLKPPCPSNGGTQTYENLGRSRVFHWVFASTNGRPAEFLALRHLYSSPNPKMHIESHNGRLHASWE